MIPARKIESPVQLLVLCWWFTLANYLFSLVQRNYRFFFMFVFSTTLLCIYVFGFCGVYIKKIMDAEETNVWKAMTKTPASIVLIIYTFVSVWFVGGLSAFHLYLISTNQVIGLLSYNMPKVNGANHWICYNSFILLFFFSFFPALADNLWEFQIPLWSAG